MPSITPGGKYIYGWLKVKEDRTLYLPDEPLEELPDVLKKDPVLFNQTEDGYIYRT